MNNNSNKKWWFVCRIKSGIRTKKGWKEIKCISIDTITLAECAWAATRMPEMQIEAIKRHFKHYCCCCISDINLQLHFICVLYSAFNYAVLLLVLLFNARAMPFVYLVNWLTLYTEHFEALHLLLFIFFPVEKKESRNITSPSWIHLFSDAFGSIKQMTLWTWFLLC